MFTQEPELELDLYQAVKSLQHALSKNNLAKISTARTALKQSLQAVAQYENKMHPVWLQVIMVAFISSTHFLRHTQIFLEEKIQELIHTQLATETNPELATGCAGEPQYKLLKQDPASEDHVKADLLNAQIEMLRRDLQIVIEILKYQISIDNNTLEQQTLNKIWYTLSNSHTDFLIQRLKDKSQALVESSGFVIIATNELLIHAAVAHLSCSGEKSDKLKHLLQSRTCNNLLPTSLIRLIADRLRDTIIPPTDTCTFTDEEYFEMDWVEDIAVVTPPLLTAKCKIVKEMIVKLGFVFETSRLNSRASSPASKPPSPKPTL